MSSRHPSRERLKSLVQGLSPGGRDLLQHVAACSRCGEIFAQLTDHDGWHAVPGVLAWQQRSEPTEADSLQTDLETAAASGPEQDAGRVPLDDDLEALEALRELRGCGVDLSSEAERRTSWSLVECVLAESRKRRYTDPQLAERIALLALRLLSRVETQVYGDKLVMDLTARTWTYVGVARRMAGALRTSEEAFQRAWTCFHKGTGDPLEEALLLESHGILLTDQRQHEEGARCFEKAVRSFLSIGDQEAAARAMMNLAIVHHYQGQMELAIETLASATEHLQQSDDKVLKVSVHHNLITFLTEADEYEQAQSLLDRHDELYRDADPVIQMRREWVQARIHRGMGRLEEAENGFLEARESYIQAGVGYDAALISLDMATMYAEQGRFSEMRRLADEMLPIFRAQDIHREALAALAIFQQAARVEGVTLKLARELSEYLGKARNQPHLRFEASR